MRGLFYGHFPPCAEDFCFHPLPLSGQIWYNMRILARGNDSNSPRQNRFPAQGTGRAHTPGASPSILRTWDASQESLRNYACKDAQKGNCPRTAVSPPSVYLYGLSQAPLAMHRRRFPFPAFSGVCQGASPRRTRPSRPMPQGW